MLPLLIGCGLASCLMFFLFFILPAMSGAATTAPQTATQRVAATPTRQKASATA